MPAPSGSGYEQILAARGELRTRADRAIADARRPSAKPAAAPIAPAATWSLEQLPTRPHRFDRRDRPALIVWASLTAPAACVLVAFAWVGSPRSPALPAVASEGSRVSLQVANAGFVAPLPSASEGDPLFAARASQPRTAPDDAEPVVPHKDMWLRPKPNDAEAEPAFAAPAGGSEPQTAEADPGPAQESASPDAVPGSPDMLPEEVQAAFATWDRSTSASAADDGPEAGPAEGGPVLAASDRDAVVAGTASDDSGTPEDGRTPSTATGAAMDAETTRDDPAEGGAAMAVAPDHAPPAVPMTVDATETAALEEAREASASAEPGERDAALATEPGPPLEERRQASATRPALAGQAPEAARPSAGTDAAAGSEASSEPSTAASPPPRMAGLVASPPAPPTPAAPPPTKPRLDGASHPPVSRSAAAGGGPAASAPPSTDPRCRAIVVKAQLGEETSHAERLLLRSGCGARR